MTPREFGWWLESTDEEIYGPVTTATIATFLQEGVISANTAVRHCTDAASAPVVDQGIIEGIDWAGVSRSGDKLAASWPRRTRDRLALAESDIECAYHRRPAVLTCIRCLAPYCPKCQLRKKRGATYFMCKKCQSSVFNRRFAAFMLDSFLINGIPIWVAMVGVMVVSPTQAAAEAGMQFVNILSVGFTGVFIIRDPVMRGAGPGKRLFGLRVVKHEDGSTPLSYGQAFVRWLGHLVPLFNLVDASRAYSDPLQRRFGDSWAKTRVLDVPAKVQKARDNAHRKLERKGFQFPVANVMSLQEFAKIDG
jgi:uncharacterized RDD family membrane protein YckC